MGEVVYWRLLREFNMPICGSRGPRIGSEGAPVCKMLPSHRGSHTPDINDGWGPIAWEGY